MDKVIFYSNIRNLIFKKCSIQFLIINDTVAHKEQVAMGALVYGSGGLLIDNGWLRIAGSGHPRLPRDPVSWTQRPEFAGVRALPIADDVAGGIFALNGGDLGEDTGCVYYFAPDTLNWESLEVGYSEFLQWALSGDLDTFYENVRWQQWREDVIKLSATEAFTFYPFLWVQSEEARTRKVISLTELWEMQYQMKETFTQ
ncbi:TPA: DUF2625 family protein [Escherichia coli]|nr:DUF2625 family protein [Escherichia coli]EFO4034578.1 hypothetical protein [Escherichia coli]EGO4486449.1 DUF2625 family protein [Escherichia coli]HBP8077830.1 DUF2625 family protein [Escherichia coli]HCZ5338266.1 DUF2625 family protein [Escherichia coli]